MFIFEKVGHSKFVEMHGDTSDYFRSASKSDRYFFFINCDLFIELLLTDLNQIKSKSLFKVGTFYNNTT